jgi:probable rRNA maturation factor
LTDASPFDQMRVDILYETRVDPEFTEESLTELVERVCRKVADAEELAPSEVSVSIVGDDRIRELNARYRGRDEVTDVLSFALLEGGYADAEPVPSEVAEDMEVPFQALGDIVINFSRARLQAAEYGHSTERELAFLTAHGMFHLLGYDHMSAADEADMTSRQEAVLESLGYTR